jgi:lipopolysaccharide/colanic/teichoic acid biosynthesis glycosyltransferase
MSEKRRIAIFGDGRPAEQCDRALASDFGVELVTPHRAELDAAVEERKVDLVALCNPDAGLAAQLELADGLLTRGVDTALLRPCVPHGIEGLGLARRWIDGRPLLFLPARPIPHRPAAVKRLFDVVFSAAVLLLGLPLWAAIALGIKLQDGGPVFFAQDRVGPDGSTFRFIKFRTMWPDADEHREWYEQRHGREGHLFKLEDDPRRTAFGRILRRFSLDEIPQFLHALSGTMSVVGPRPPLVSEVGAYRPWQRRRLAGWFGLTGLWQVCGRSEVRDLDEIVLLDLLYLHHHSAALDLRIILRTLRVVLTRHGAY